MKKKKDEFLEYCLNEVKKGGFKRDLQLLEDESYCPTLLCWDSTIEDWALGIGNTGEIIYRSDWEKMKDK